MFLSLLSRWEGDQLQCRLTISIPPPARRSIEADLLVGEFDFGGEVRERKGALVFIQGQVAHHPVPVSGHLVGEGPGGLVVLQRDATG